MHGLTPEKTKRLPVWAPVTENAPQVEVVTASSTTCFFRPDGVRDGQVVQAFAVL